MTTTITSEESKISGLMNQLILKAAGRQPSEPQPTQQPAQPGQTPNIPQGHAGAGTGAPPPAGPTDMNRMILKAARRVSW